MYQSRDYSPWFFQGPGKLASIVRSFPIRGLRSDHALPLARNLDDLRRIVQTLTGKGVRIEFVKEHLSFTGEDSPMANLMLSVMGAFAEFERALIHERQREGIALAKQRGAYKGRKKSLAITEVAQLRERIATGISKAQAAREFGISRQTLYQYLK